jgi:hypothetical protein
MLVDDSLRRRHPPVGPPLASKRWLTSWVLRLSRFRGHLPADWRKRAGRSGCWVRVGHGKK